MRLLSEFPSIWPNTGKERVLNKRTEFVAMHRDKHCFAVSLTVSKVSGIGEDTLLMGVIEVRSQISEYL